MFIKGFKIIITEAITMAIIIFLNTKIDGSFELNIKIIGYQELAIPLFLSKNKIDLGDIYMTTKSLKLKSVHIHSHGNNSKQISISIPNFSGPLEVLLDLAKTQKVDLAEISITKLADQFLEFIKKK